MSKHISAAIMEQSDETRYFFGERFLKILNEIRKMVLTAYFKRLQ